MEVSPHREMCLHRETFVTYLPQSSVKELPLRPPTWSLFRERSSIPRVPFIQLSKSQVEEPSSRFPKQGPYHKRLTWYWLSHSYWCATYGSSVQISRYSLPMIVWWIWLIILTSCTKQHYKSHTSVLAGQMCHKRQRCGGNVHHSGTKRCSGYIFITFT
jgi:hypothetical protein